MERTNQSAVMVEPKESCAGRNICQPERTEATSKDEKARTAEMRRDDDRLSYKP